MGNCFSEVTAGRAAIGGTAGDFRSLAGAPNDAVENFLRSRGHHGLFSQIELSFSASGLGDRDVLFKNNPMMVLYAKGKTGALEEICRTEVVLNSSSPTWITKHTLIYHFEVVQVLVFRVYDVDTQFHNLDIKMLELDEQQFLGEATCVLSQIITQRDQSLTIDLHTEDSLRSTLPKNCGKLLVHAEECVSSKTAIEMAFRCSDLECKDLFSRNDPFLLISKVAEGGVHIPICKTEVIKNDLNPIWKSVFVNIQQVGSKESILIIECYNYNSNGRHDLIGKVQRSLAELENIHNNGQGENLFLPSSGGQNHDNKVLKSQLFVDRFIESVQYTFLDYLAGGFELNFMVAVDFTGPTLFGPVISTAALIASQSVANGGRKYFVLLIITDGVVTDLQETKDAIVKASDLPLSILIVGVGGADFKEMEVLDADKGERLESSYGRVASRDIVQFVPFREVQSGFSVVQALLAELPTQFLTYVRSRDIQPNL
ncbi:protein BONZAI 1 isoform X3 [Vigna angularis]|uniref:protein BONZAI 1 isoform X3 n=1 Tax=Phaseolus angularis TaxID=3914 RepID=UPI0022B2EBEA|nr:protein BONZAI 1 isoform X3 [Vigna angularis]